MMISRITLVGLALFVFSVSLHKCSSNPITSTEIQRTTEKSSTFVTEIETTEMPNTTDFYVEDDILSTMAAEFLFLVAGDHVFLPGLPNPKEDLKLHKTAQIFARLLTNLRYMQRVYKSLNTTTQDISIYSWYRPGNIHLFFKIFDKVIEEVEKDPELHAEWRKIEANMTDEMTYVRSHGNQTSTEKKTFYDMTTEQMIKTEQLFGNELVKKVILSIELLNQSEEDLDDLPKSAELLRKYIIIAKAMFKFVSSDNLEIRSHAQQIFDEAAKEVSEKYDVITGSDYDSTLYEAAKEVSEKYDVITGSDYDSTLYEALQSKIDKDKILKNEFEKFKERLLLE